MANQAIDYIFHHVFLPPQLPQSDDFSVHNETALVSCVLDCLVKFKNYVFEEQSAAVQSAIGLIQAFIRVHIDLGDTTAVGEFELREVLRDLDCVGGLCMLSDDLGASAYSCTGGVVPLHVRAQNAGVLITKTISDMHIETFEVSPENKAVVSTIGRLRRCFPGSAIAIDLETTSQEGSIEVLAATLAKMSSQSAPDTQPEVKKAGQLHQENRDTTHPKIVTELLNAYLLALGRPLPGTRLWKNTREEVLWSNCYLPWRRSPTWLLIRVALQLVFGRRAAELGLAEDLYKSFMLFLVAEILNQSLEIGLSSETLILMNAKVSRRLHKLEDDREGLWLSHVRQTMCRANEILAARWSAIQQRDAPPLNLDRLRTLDFEKDTIMHLPELDEFLAQLCHRQKTTEPCDFTPSWALAKTRPETLPDLSFTHDREHLTFNLESFEVWVENHLENWLKRRMDQKDTDACAELRQLIEGYHLVASDFYLESPEETSIMLLTILELWIGCDKMATALYPMLLEYDPGIPKDFLQNMLLPLRQHMTRLQRAESYINHRSKRSRFSAPKIYVDFGSQDSFSVRYYDRSADHQRLFDSIQAQAKKDRQHKRLELQRLTTKYNDLMDQYGRMDCQYETFYSHTMMRNETIHSNNCKRHACFNTAKSLSIHIHEWPLPSSELEAKSVTFELSVPPSFGEWREATVFALFSVFKVKDSGEKVTRDRFHLEHYQGLSSFFNMTLNTQLVSLVSLVKPHIITHRKAMSVATATESQVCLNNGLRYSYYNGRIGYLLSDFLPTHNIPRLCSYSLPKESSSLEQFLFRPASKPNGPSPNTVIARQSGCPDHMAFDEFKGLCSLPLGYRLQWMNILVQIFSPSVDFKKSEVRLVTLQCIYQAGPPCNNVLREAHKICEDTRFCGTLLEGLHDATLRFEKNWQSSTALCTFVSIATRLLSITISSAVRAKCLEYLCEARRATFAWVGVLKNDAQKCVDGNEKLSIQKRVLELALICSETFNVDDAFRKTVFSSNISVSIFVQCTIAIQETSQPCVGNLAGTLRHLYSRWQRSCLHSYGILAERIVAENGAGLDDAIFESWSGYEPRDQWHILSRTHDYWLTRRTGPAGDTLPLHYCLLTGELLVNGVPLDHLPTNYLNHPTYETLFGRLSLEIMPTSVSGMQFSSKRQHSDHEIHLGMESGESNPDLRVQALHKGLRLELIPKRCLLGRFPIAFVEDYVHWYDYGNDSIEFCDASSPWYHSLASWRLRRAHNNTTWVLVRNDATLINILSATAILISTFLSPLEDITRVHASYHGQGSSILIDLPRLGLGFALTPGESLIRSRQLPGMSIDENQAIGTLVGLESLLVLKEDIPQHPMLFSARKVLIPNGPVSCRKSEDHVKVTITKTSSTGFLSYDVDHQLGRLISNSSRQSRLFLSYLHALTSFGLPDPLTGKTGTESALAILTSASIMSVDRLTRENIEILVHLAELTPGRVYYPPNETVMQSVAWSSNLGCLAQHGLFFECVSSVFKIAKRLELFHPQLHIEPPCINRVISDLLKRDNIRSSTFRVSGFGAERHEVNYDVKYKARDTSESSKKAKAFEIGSFIYYGRTNLVQALPPHPQNHLWNFLASDSLTVGPYHSFEPHKIMYDAEYLQEPTSYIQKNWILLHRYLHTINKFRAMIWHVTLSFSETADIHIVQILSLFHTSKKLLEIAAPCVGSLRLSDDTDFQREKVRDAVSSGFTSFWSSPEARLPPETGETTQNLHWRRELTFDSRKRNFQNQVVSFLQNQWPCESPEKPPLSSLHNPFDPLSTTERNWEQYIDWELVKDQIKSQFLSWYNNRNFQLYLTQLIGRLPTCATPMPVPSSLLVTPPWDFNRKLGFLSYDENFRNSANFPLKNHGWTLRADYQQAVSNPNSRLSKLLEALKNMASVRYERQYLDDLEDSLDALKAFTLPPDLAVSVPESLEGSLATYLQTCRNRVDGLYYAMEEALFTTKVKEAELHTEVPDFYQRSRHSPLLFLQRLNKNFINKTPKPWLDCIIEYGIALTQLQRAERMLSCLDDPIALTKELCNPGHTNWRPQDFPDTLLLEVESGIMVRKVQEDISNNMRNPPLGKNAVMQLNMGEGKSSVIVPIVSVALANGSRLVVVVVAKPQSKQMLQMLDVKLGGLLDRRIFHLPFTRAVKLGEHDAETIHGICQDCMESGGIMLIQPEHILSFQLMGIESAISGRMDVSRSLLKTKHFLDQNSRYIIDESDENFSVKFELVYTMGTQRPVEHSPTRWVCIHHVLDVFRKALPEVEKRHPEAIEIIKPHDGCFPRTRILGENAKEMLLYRIAQEISEAGTIGLPMATQSAEIQRAVFAYIWKPSLLRFEIDAVENSSIWSASTKDTLLLLRGLIGCGILAFAFCQKRWRVDFGLDPNRWPSTRLAVPYRAKDNPALRSEFSHPEIIILLTSLSYYYKGLDHDELFLNLEHLLRSDQADMEYRVWVSDSDKLPLAFTQLSGVNIEDRAQCIEFVFPCFCYAKGAIDYFLSHIVFTKELKEFPYKLSASGWDIGETKAHPTTGFSGTCDARALLPLSVTQLDLPDQRHTNALVMANLLQEENTIEMMARGKVTGKSDAETLLETVVRLEPPVRVILDVGAQILELENMAVAKRWLEMVEDGENTQAVIFCDENDHICVIDRKDRIELLHTSPFLSRTDVCLVFLDEAHTRGTDLKLPKHYRAAVTLGANLPKDRLVQACMRMRELGKGQTVVFCIPDEIRRKIIRRFGCNKSDLTVEHIFQWAISDTWIDMQRSIWLWANQGRRHQRHSELWSEARGIDSIELDRNAAERFLEDEAQSLEKRYRPGDPTTGVGSGPAVDEAVDAITERLDEFGGADPKSATFREEQERELSPEVEEQREVQKPPDATPAKHCLHPDIRAFISTGVIKNGSEGCMPAFQAFAKSSASRYFDTKKFPHGLLVTKDFAQTIVPFQKGYVSDIFQRTVQWILTTKSDDGVIGVAMIISPFEAQELLPSIQKSRLVSLHLYAPRPNTGFRALDSLDLYTIPRQPVTRVLPRQIVTELNLFAGQMYAGSFDEYLEIRQFLGFNSSVVNERWVNGQTALIVGPTGAGQLDAGLIQFMKVLMMKIRRNCESIDKTHIGRILDQQLLSPSDFDSSCN